MLGKEEREMVVVAGESSPFSIGSFPADGQTTAPDSVFALDVLRQRLHEKMQLARGQVSGECS